MPAEESAPLESRQQSRAGSLLVDRFAVWVGFGADQAQQPHQLQPQRQQLDGESEAAKAGAGNSSFGGGAVPPSVEAVVVVPKLFESSERRLLLAKDSSESSADCGAGTSDRNRRQPTPTPAAPPQPPSAVSAQRAAAAAAAVAATEGGLRFDGTYSESVRSTESSVDSFESADGLLFPDSSGDVGFADAEAFSPVETVEAEEAREFMSIRLGEGSTEGERQATMGLSPLRVCCGGRSCGFAWSELRSTTGVGSWLAVSTWFWAEKTRGCLPRC